MAKIKFIVLVSLGFIGFLILNNFIFDFLKISDDINNKNVAYLVCSFISILWMFLTAAICYLIYILAMLVLDEFKRRNGLKPVDSSNYIATIQSTRDAMAVQQKTFTMIVQPNPLMPQPQKTMDIVNVEKIDKKLALNKFQFISK